MEYYDDSYDYYDAYEDWGEGGYDESGYGYDGYEEYGNEEEYWYDAEEEMYGGYEEEGGYGQDMYQGSYDEQGGHGQGYEQDYGQDYGQSGGSQGYEQGGGHQGYEQGGGHQGYDNMDEGYGGGDQGYGNMTRGYEEMNSQQPGGGYNQYDQEGQYWQFHEEAHEGNSLSHFHDSDEYQMMGPRTLAVPEMSRAGHMLEAYGTTNLPASDYHLSPIRAEHSSLSQSYQSFLPSAMAIPSQRQNHGPSRAVSLNRSQRLTLQPETLSPPTSSSSPTAGMFRDLFWKSQNRGSTPEPHSRSPLSRGHRSPSRTGLPTPRSADGRTRPFDGDFRRPDTAIGFLAPLTP